MAKKIKHKTKIQLAVSKYRVVVEGSIILLEDWTQATVGELVGALNETVGLNVSPLYLFRSLAGNSRFTVIRANRVRLATIELR